MEDTGSQAPRLCITWHNIFFDMIKGDIKPCDINKTYSIIISYFACGSRGRAGGWSAGRWGPRRRRRRPPPPTPQCTFARSDVV